MFDIFQEVREQISAESAARFYGLDFDRRNWCRCPFHNDHHASMSFRSGRFRCWSCGASGDSITLVSRFFSLKPLAAAEKLNSDFFLGLPLRRKLTPEDCQAVLRRKKVLEISQAYEMWRNRLINQLNEIYRMAHTALNSISNLDELTGQQVEAIQVQAYVEYIADLLTNEDMATQMQVFRQRKEVETLCNRILNSMPMKSIVA